MSALLQPNIILLLFVLVFSLDMALGRVDTIRKIAYGALAILALVYLIIVLIIH